MTTQMTETLTRVGPVLLQAATQAQTAPWYAGASGAIALVLSVIALGTTIYGWGWKARRQTETLNGFGKRMDKVEEAQTRSHERDLQWVRSLEQVLESNKQLVLAIGRAEGNAIQCQVDMQDSTDRIRGEIQALVQSIHASDLAAEGRMARVETEVRLMREVRKL